MKIKKIALGLACLTAFPVMAADGAKDYSFYGSLRAMVEMADHENGDDFKDPFSRIGVTGSHDLGEGLTAFGTYEIAVDLAEGELNSASGEEARVAEIGLTGDFGTVKVGKMWSAFYNSIGYAGDQLTSISAPTYYSLGDTFRIKKSVMYVSPEKSGLQVALLHSSDGDEVSEATVSYQATENLKLAAGFIDDQDTDTTGLSAWYSGDGFYVNAAYMDKENVGKGADIIGGVFHGKNTYSLGVSTIEKEGAGAADFEHFILSFQRQVHPSVLLWADARTWDGEYYVDGFAGGSSTLNVGVNYNF